MLVSGVEGQQGAPPFALLMDLKSFACVGALLLVVVAADAQRPEHNAFLNTRVVSVSELLTQLKRDPEVRDRYMRHYGLSQAEVGVYFSTLRIAKLKAPGTFRVYGVPADGQIHVTMQPMKAQALVLVDIGGAPVMRMYCGNPMTLGPKDPTDPNDAEADVINSEKVTVAELEDPEAMASTDLQAETVALEPSIDAVPEANLPAGQTPPTTTQTVGQAPATIVGNVGGFNPIGFLPAIGFLVPARHRNPRPPPVPEPASIAALTLGAGVLLARKRRS